MKKDIKKAIIGLCISLFLFALGLFIASKGIHLEFPNEIIRIVIAVFEGLSIMVGFLLSIMLFIVTIGLISTEIHNKKAEKYNAQLEEKTREELPQNVEFSVNITDVNNEEIRYVYVIYYKKENLLYISNRFLFGTFGVVIYNS